MIIDKIRCFLFGHRWIIFRDAQKSPPLLKIEKVCGLCLKTVKLEVRSRKDAVE